MPLAIPLRINHGCTIWVNQHGEKTFTLLRAVQAVGSHDCRMQVRAEGSMLEFSGNPAKFLRGHNVYGDPGGTPLGAQLGAAMLESIGIDPAVYLGEGCNEDDIPLTRIDLCRMYRPEFATAGWVPKWLAIAGSVASGGHQRVQPRGAYNGLSLYVGEGSRRISSKFYDKQAELKKHPLPLDLAEGAIPEILEHARDTLRFEVTVRSMEMKKRRLQTLKDWTPEVGDAVLDERLALLTLPDDLRMSEEAAEDLPRNLKAVYRLWAAGEDLRAIYKKAQFYRHRKALREYGIEITHVQPSVLRADQERRLGRPLRDYVAGPGLEMPEAADRLRVVERTA